MSTGSMGIPTTRVGLSILQTHPSSYSRRRREADMAFQQLTLSQGSLVKTPSGITELYIPLWVYSNSGGNATGNFAGSLFLVKGGTNGPFSNSGAKLHTLNANWSPTQKFALEVSIYSSNSAGTAYAELWDMTSNSGLVASQISTTSTTATLLRSGQFTLTPGHAYGVTLWNSSSSYSTYITKAHLIAFL
jgi:hypothetical protein